MNKQMKDLFKKDLTGYTCWKSFHDNQDCPCEFCSNNKLISADGNPTAPYIWEFCNQKLNTWYELHDQAILWDDGRIVRLEIATDITKSKRIEKDQKEYFNSLEGKIKSIIPESNNLDTAIQGILKHRDIDKNTNENQKFSCLKRLSETSLSHEQQTLLKGIESYIAQILFPFPLKLSPCISQLTLMETKIVNLIKKGNNTKEIAAILNLSPRTIEKHREKIRAKLSIKNTKVNLYSYLMSIYSEE
ncbi:MAG: helix-turn-helix transcriptional regulator [Desulfobacteraceae bacterium]|nr:helix-turn-helix transcriptional regulator [Desulfobacteraceae bacterium]